MARRRRAKTRIRTVTRTVGRKVRRASESPLMKALYGAMYGAGRKYVADLVTPTLQSVLGPAGVYADNIAMAGISYLMTRSGNKTMKKIGTTGLIIEGALIGNEILSAVKGGSTTTGNATLSVR